MKIDFTIKRKILRIDGSQRELIFEIAALIILSRISSIACTEMFVVHISKYAKKKKIALYCLYLKKLFRIISSNVLIV